MYDSKLKREEVTKRKHKEIDEWLQGIEKEERNKKRVCSLIVVDDYYMILVISNIINTLKNYL